jgi:hypothetical protein
VDAVGAAALRRARRAALALGLTVWLGSAAAQAPVAGAAPRLDPEALAELLVEPPIGTPCAEDGAIVTVEGVGRAVFDRIAYDGANGTATLSGGVCLEVPASGVRLRADRVELAGLPPGGAGTARLRSTRPILDVQDWRLRVGTLSGPVDDVRASPVVLVGPGLVGVARSASLRAGAGRLTDAAVATSGYLLEAGEAVLEDGRVRLRDVSGTSCTCGVERYRLAGRSLRADLTGGGATLEAPTLQVLGVELPLGTEAVLRPDGVAEVEAPLTVERRDELGTVAALRLRPGGGVRLELGGSSLPAPGPLVGLDARRDGREASLAADGRGVELRGSARAGGDGGWVELRTEALPTGDEPRLRTGVAAGATVATGLASDGAATAAASIEGGVELAAEPASGAVGAASPRLPVEALLTLEGRPSDAVRLGLEVAGTATAYPGALEDGRFGQASLRIRPSATFASSGGRLALHFERRWVTGSSPFAFDAPEPRARLGAALNLTAGPVDGRADVDWRLPPEDPGAETLSARLSVDLPLAGAWRLVPSLRAELSGLAGGEADEDWIEAELAAVRGEDTRIAVAGRTGGDPWELRHLTVAAQAPLPLGDVAGDVRLVPYLAIDVAPLLRAGSGPTVAGHGLRAYVPDCCGTLIMGYRTEQDELRFEVAVRLPPLRLAQLPEAPLPRLPSLPPGYGDRP